MRARRSAKGVIRSQPHSDKQGFVQVCSLLTSEMRARGHMDAAGENHVEASGDTAVPVAVPTFSFLTAFPSDVLRNVLDQLSDR